jgi:hypothetical protein
MKAIFLAFLAGAASALAQDFVAPAGRHREVVQEFGETRPTIEGMVREIFTKKPWLAVSPLAPKSAGSGERFVSRDFGPSTPNHSRTLTVVGVEW